jgi:hypothetical protein
METWQHVRAKIAADGAPTHASKVVDQRHFVHASAGSPTAQYVWPAHECQYVVFNRQVDERITQFLAEFQAPHGFNGHTHVPAVLTRYDHHGVFDFYQGAERHHVHTFVGRNGPVTVAVNVGSAGQPRRLGDNRASYVLTDGEDLGFRRVEYPWAKTAAKIAQLPIDPDQQAELIERLETGV